MLDGSGTVDTSRLSVWENSSEPGSRLVESVVDRVGRGKRQWAELTQICLLRIEQLLPGFARPGLHEDLVEAADSTVDQLIDQLVRGTARDVRVGAACVVDHPDAAGAVVKIAQVGHVAEQRGGGIGGIVTAVAREDDLREAELACHCRR